MAVKELNGKETAVSRTGAKAVAGMPHPAILATIACLLAALYFHPVREMTITWSLPDSYYSHGYLIPFICLFLLWKDRARHAGIPIAPNPALGYPTLALALLFVVVGDFLSFAVFTQFSLLPMLSGLVLLLFGVRHFRAAWFPIWYLFFMVPIPPSITSSITFGLKLKATEGAVWLAKLLHLPVVHVGSYVMWTTDQLVEDQLLVGDVCGGLRSLIALLALGVLMGYISKNATWARFALIALAPPIAIVTNILRIFTLCVVAYHWGSPAATGWVHDVSGIMIFVVALAVFFACDIAFSRVSRPAGKREPAP